MSRRAGVILSVTNLTVRRGRASLLRNVNWQVRDGEHWAILGSNGSGKTSLLSALTGYLTPTVGDVTLLGRRYGEDDWRESRSSIGLVSSSVRQRMAAAEPALATVISGRYAVIDYWGKLTQPDCNRARRLLRRVECVHLEDRPWGVLSQGERQRVLIARALMAQPRLLILDEPCAGLDPVARERFLQFLQRLGRRRSAPVLVLVTHHVEEILPVFSHALVLRAGGVLAAGDKASVLTSKVLARAFGARVKLTSRAGRFALRVAPSTRVVI